MYCLGGARQKLPPKLYVTFDCADSAVFSEHWWNSNILPVRIVVAFAVAIYTRCTWAGVTCVNYPDFFENHQFYCVSLAHVLFSKNFWFTIHVVDSWFWRIIDQIYLACAIFCWIPNLRVCTDRQTDGRTDELIRVVFGSSRLTFLILIL